jgi:hypothetical protein
VLARSSEGQGITFEIEIFRFEASASPTTLPPLFENGNLDRCYDANINKDP